MSSRVPTARNEERAAVLARLRRMVRRWPQVSGCRLNPDAVVVEGTVQGLVRSSLRYGYPYCPCRDVSGDSRVDKDNICPCRWHHAEIQHDHHCRCQLFVDDAYDPAVAYRADGVAPMVESPCVRERDITLYSTRWCFHSRRTKAFLAERQIPYTNVDIEEDARAAALLERWNAGLRSAPTLVIRQVLVEPQTAELQQMLGDLPPGPKSEVVRVMLYRTEHCPDCETAIDWLRARRIPHEVVGLESAPGALQQIQAWNGGQARVPTLGVTVRLSEPSA